MSILVGRHTKVLVQGLGSAGRFHTDRAVAYGTRMVAGVHPGKGGTQMRFEGETDHSGVPDRDDAYRVDLPMFETVRDAVRETDATASVVYVPPSPPPTRSSRRPTPAWSWWSPSPRASPCRTWYA